MSTEDFRQEVGRANQSEIRIYKTYRFLRRHGRALRLLTAITLLLIELIHSIFFERHK